MVWHDIRDINFFPLLDQHRTLWHDCAPRRADTENLPIRSRDCRSISFRFGRPEISKWRTADCKLQRKGISCFPFMMHILHYDEIVQEIWFGGRVTVEEFRNSYIVPGLPLESLGNTLRPRTPLPHYHTNLIYSVDENIRGATTT